MNKLRRMFNPTHEEEIEDNQKIINIISPYYKNRGCSTCGNCKHVIDYPGFVTGEECECTVGLKCDTVLFTIKDCPKYIDDDKLEKLIKRNEELLNIINNK